MNRDDVRHDIVPFLSNKVPLPINGVRVASEAGLGG